ncbi:MAG: oligosaccharide flippase family protein, partial [candidate division KSB1 bacterium]
VILVYGGNAHLGALHAMNREVPQRRGRGESDVIPQIARVSLTFTMLATAIVAAVLFALGLSPWFDAVTAGALRLLALVLLAQQLYQFFHFWFRADEKFALLSKVLIFATVLELAVTLALVRVLGFDGIFYGFLLSSLAAVLICFVAVPPHLRRPHFDFSLIPGLIRAGFPIMIIGLSYSLMTTLDRLLIINFLGEEQLGYYALGTLALTAMAYIPTAINQVLYPKMGERFGATAQAETLAPLVEKPTLVTAGVMAAVLGLAYLALPLTPLLLPQYTEGIPTARILFAGFYFLGLVGGSANLLITINRQTQYLTSLLLAIGLGLLLNAIALMLRLGIEGIAATTGVMYLVYAFGMISFTAQRYLQRDTMHMLGFGAKLLLPFLAAALLIFIATHLALPNLILTIALRLAFFALLYFAPGFFLLHRELKR